MAALKVNTAHEMYVFVDDVMALTGLAKSKCYAIIRELNGELSNKGYYTVQGRVSRKYFLQRFGLEDSPAVKRGRKTAR